jgi:hypothetical protein
MSAYGNLFGQSYQPVKPRVFVSYHHDNDQRGYDSLVQFFANTYDLVTDRSLKESIDSDNVDYVMQTIRENFITGTSLTIVLCGPETWKRKYVDWEIKATLDKEHALLGLQLPTLVAGSNGLVIIPARLHDNIQSGFAHWAGWVTEPTAFASAIQVARSRSNNTRSIINSRDMMGRNL